MYSPVKVVELGMFRRRQVTFSNFPNSCEYFRNFSTAFNVSELSEERGLECIDVGVNDDFGSCMMYEREGVKTGCMFYSLDIDRFWRCILPNDMRAIVRFHYIAA